MADGERSIYGVLSRDLESESYGNEAAQALLRARGYRGGMFSRVF